MNKIFSKHITVFKVFADTVPNKFIKLFSLPWIRTMHIRVCLLYSLFQLFNYFLIVCLFAGFFFRLFVCVVIKLLFFLYHLSSFLCISTYLCFYWLAFCTIILLLFTISLETDISVYDLVLFIYFVLLFIYLLVHTCLIMYVFLHFFALIICNLFLLFSLLFIYLHVDYDVINASLYLYLFLCIYMHLFRCFNGNIFTLHIYYTYNSIPL